MTPEEIRRVFAEQITDKDEVHWAIEMAMGELKKLPDAATRAASPYSLSKLTAGLPHGNDIISVALLFNARNRQAKARAQAEIQRQRAIATTVHDSAPESPRWLEAEITEARKWFYETLLHNPGMAVDLPKAFDELGITPE